MFVQAGPRPLPLVNVEHILLRQCLLLADCKQTVKELVHNLSNALDRMNDDLDAVSADDRRYFVHMLDREVLDI